MSQLFLLQLSDNVDTPINFISSAYKVEDGGFDIGLPSVRRELAPVRPGFYIPVISEVEYRESTIKFEIRGSTRAQVISRLNAIERLLNNVANRKLLGNGRRAEIQYAWEGADNITYFEVYGGEVSFPRDALSVAKVHRIMDGVYAIPECELRLYLSGSGYALSLFSDALTEVALYNPTVGAKQTGGVTVKNPGYYLSGTWQPQYNYVEIDGDDLPGSTPLITKIQLASGATYSLWNFLYMGLQQSPFPSSILFDNSTLAYSVGGTTPSSTNASQGTYRSYTYPNTAPWTNFFADFAWSVGNNTIGMFYAFLHSFDAISSNFHIAIGVDDYVSFGVRTVGEWSSYSTTNKYVLPLGLIQLPPVDLAVADQGTLHPNLEMGLFVSGEDGATLTIDYVSLLPVTAGLRMWRSRVSNLTGTLVDDGWRGIEYLKDGSNQVSTPFHGLLEPLKLSPGITQRIYFTSGGAPGVGVASERLREFTARVYVVPTYASMAM